MDRRSFLRGLVATPAAVAAASLMPVSARLLLPPKLWGDGIHDDTAALKHLIAEAARKGRPFVLDGGTYKISDTLVMPDTGCELSNCRFNLTDTDNGPIFSVPRFEL